MRPAISLVLGSNRYALRPTYGALLATEDEIGSLFALVERASEGRLLLKEIISLLWHCLHPQPDGLTRAAFGTACVEAGLAQLTPAFRTLLEQALGGV